MLGGRGGPPLPFLLSQSISRTDLTHYRSSKSDRKRSRQQVRKDGDDGRWRKTNLKEKYKAKPSKNNV